MKNPQAVSLCGNTWTAKEAAYCWQDTSESTQTTPHHTARHSLKLKDALFFAFVTCIFINKDYSSSYSSWTGKKKEKKKKNHSKKLQMSHPWRCSRPGWMGLWASWTGGCQHTHGRGLELGELWYPSQPKPFCDSMKRTAASEKKMVACRI